ncbi:hypothetical protein TNCV_2852481 [Trichonephila clavipes]|uniref:Uncharacterized protein n=1 Tax=Trichonephila clavipes TaxID=2585209 RepID=A0A8X6UV47_TRICX|nr:hypothetical protein TNCV_2852481 [Trichonephila clavipes]
MIESVPVKLMNEFVEKEIKIFTKNGETFEGIMMKDLAGGPAVLEGMHFNLKNVKANFASGHTANLETVFIRGSRIRFVGLPSEAKELVDRMERAARPAPRGRGGRGGRGRGGYRGRR